jgi:hypothetical protein
VTLAEQLAAAVRAYRRADDRGDEVARNAAFDRMRAVHEAIQREARKAPAVEARR